MKTKIFNRVMIGMATLGLVACNDFLDKTPQGEITPDVYFLSEADLAAYTVNRYKFTTVDNGAYGISTWGYDNGTDNQASVNYSARWAPGEWLVGQSVGKNWQDTWNFTEIRQLNYFLDNTLKAYAAKQIQGSEANIRHYIGEGYLLRAYAYFDKLKSIGDCPIVTTAFADDKTTLVEHSKREPRHKVARFILADLDSAIVYLNAEAPGGKNRISKDVAHLLRSRVALFEGTWLKHHQGTAFVPGGNGWPGNPADLNGFDINKETTFFLTEAMKSAKVVADKLVGNLVNNTDTPEGMDVNRAVLNPYYMMFCDVNMENYNEVLMWKAFSVAQGVTHNIQMQLEKNGGGSGWTRGLVNSFLMRNGLPIYDSNSGYDKNWEQQNVKATLQNRDSRIQIFTKRDGDVDKYNLDKTSTLFDPTWIVKGNNETRMVTGFAIKKGKHYDSDMQTQHHYGTSGSIAFRGTEALLNYIEACYEQTNNIDATADGYWRALRTRAKVDPDYQKTIAATVMEEEAKGDFGAYSHGKLVSTTLYNIRRERRNELFGEAMRWDDLRRWRACDQVNGYQIEGMRYWGSAYEGKLLDAKGNDLVKVDVAGGTGNMSAKDNSVYIRPYQISSKNNSVFNGYRFTAAHYLNPIPQAVFRQTAAGDQTDLSTSVVYQNPGWPTTAGQGPTTN